MVVARVYIVRGALVSRSGRGEILTSEAVRVDIRFVLYVLSELSHACLPFPFAWSAVPWVTSDRSVVDLASGLWE